MTELDPAKVGAPQGEEGGAPAEEGQGKPQGEPSKPQPDEGQGGEGGKGQPEGQGKEPETPQEKVYTLPTGERLTSDQVFEKYGLLQKDYTQKSMKLSEFEKANQKGEDVPPWERDPNWQPKTVKELMDHAVSEAERRILGKQEAERQAYTEAQRLLDEQEKAIKTEDPKADMDALYEFATKRDGQGNLIFRDLSSAWHVWKDMTERERQAEQRTLKNLENRANSPAAGSKGGAGAQGGVSYQEIRRASGIRDMLADQIIK